MVLGFPSQNRKGVETGKIRKTCYRDSRGPAGSETPLESTRETEAPVLMSPGLREHVWNAPQASVHSLGWSVGNLQL